MRTRYMVSCPICGEDVGRTFSLPEEAAKIAAKHAEETYDDLPDSVVDTILPPNERINDAFIEVIHYPD